LFNFDDCAITPLGNPEQNIAGTQWNDGKTDRAGRF